MSDASPTPNPGWYHAQGDPPGTVRYWDGNLWQSEPVPAPAAYPPPPPGSPGHTTFAPGMAPADAGSRIGGRILDGILLFIVGLPISAFIYGTINIFEIEEIPRTRVIIAAVVSFAITAAYEGFMLTRFGATLGKMAVKTKVVMADTGALVQAKDALVRVAVYGGFGFLAALTATTVWSTVFQGASSILSIAGLVMLFTQARRQTPWDLVAKTIVVPR